MRRLTWFALTAFFMVRFAVPFTEAADLPVVRLGVIGPFSGASAPYGRSVLDGVTLAFEEATARGDLPVRLEIVTADDQGEHHRVGALVRDLVLERGVVGLIGSVNSACTHVVAMLCVKLQVPHITSVSTDPTITRAGSPWSFRNLADDERQAAALVRHLIEVSQARRVAVIALNDRYGLQGVRVLLRRLNEHGHRVIFTGTIDNEGELIDGRVGDLRRLRPDAVVVWSLVHPGARFIVQARQAGIDAPLFGPDGLTTPEFLTLAGPMAEGMVVTLPFDHRRDDPETRRFVSAFARRFQRQADSFAAHAYDAMGLFIQAIERGSIHPDELRDSLAATDGYPGVTGEISFDQTGNDIRDVDLARISSGRFVPLDRSGR